MVTVRTIFVLLLLLLPAQAAQKFYTYVGALDAESALLAWGTTEGDNTIGRSSASHGKAVVKIGSRQLTTSQNWIRVEGLKPDTEYEYEVAVDGRQVGKGWLRTWPRKAGTLAFFVIGDYGNATRAQYRVARAMREEFERRRNSDFPIRFVLTTGDNIYGKLNMFLKYRRTGNSDRHWERTFFAPYETIISSIPFYPTLGNHDGNQSESQEDLDAYLDNFFFPEDGPRRYYHFNYAGLADFFALDSTSNTNERDQKAPYLPEGEQHPWLKENLQKAASTPWRIAYFHHPPFTAGPVHASSRSFLKHFLELFERNRVQVVFTGHEHNFQASNARETGGIQYIVTGAGGERRSGNILRWMQKAQISAWSPQHHFLVVEVERDIMRISPKSFREVKVVDWNNKPVSLPIVVKRQNGQTGNH